MTHFDLRLQSLLLILLLSMLPSAARAGTLCPNQPEGGAVVANPNRPTISDPADITQFGVLETEYGYGRTWVGGGRQNDFSGLLKFALLCDLELRWTTDSYIDNTGPGGNAEGVGDNWVGAQYRIYHQKQHFPTLALRYEAKLPTASFTKGLGSGAPDHSFAFLASKDISKYHFDFNAGYLLSGRTAGQSYDSNFNLALAFSRPLHGRWGLTGEAYGETELSPAPAYASLLAALTYQVNPRLVIDSGYDAGITNGSPGNHFFAGFTLAITDAYARFRQRPQGANAAGTPSAH